ncbi:MAG TPA: redox-sensing transcriptional repressor Rex [Bacteroidales bacterium]|nr:redox-sensing transcriptional repressor Rex [Bacteroidales bacterium]
MRQVVNSYFLYFSFINSYMMNSLPEKTIERLSEYRRTLFRCLDEGKTHIFSHELADLHNITAVQVRRDIMFMGYASQGRKGYDITELIQVIGKILDPTDVLNIAIVGYGHLGKAISSYLLNRRPNLKIVAAFDIDPKKIGSNSVVTCYSVDRLREIISASNISLALLTVSAAAAQQMAKALVASGIKGILNFTSANLSVPPDIYLEEYDMITLLEKVAYFVKMAERLS